MSALQHIDPVLAALEYLEGYRRSWRCWLEGGPAAIDELCIRGHLRVPAAQVVAELEYDRDAPGAHPHAPQVQEVVPPEATHRHVLRLLRWAWAHPSRHHAFRGRDTAALLAAVDCMRPSAGDLIDRLWRVCGRIADTLWFRSYGAVRLVALEARVAEVTRTDLQLGRLQGQFWCVGTPKAHRSLFVSPHRLAGGWMVLGCSVLLALGWWLAAAGAGHVGPQDLLVLLAVLLNVLSIHHDPALAARQAAGVLRYAARSRGARPLPAITVCGPEPARSALLFSLFAHLAAFAQLSDRHQGGVVLDDAVADLYHAAEPGAGPPEWSSAYRMQFGEAVPGPRQARLVHVVCPDDGPDELCTRAFRRSRQLWLVLPTAGGEQGDRAAAAAAEAARAAHVSITLVWDGPPVSDPLAGYPATRRVLAGCPYGVWSADLAELRDRYLAGGMRPEEAAGLVRWLCGEISEPPEEPPLAAAEGPAALPAHASAPSLRVYPCSSVGQNTAGRGRPRMLRGEVLPTARI